MLTPGALERICMENFHDDSIFETSFNQYAAHNFSWNRFTTQRSNNIIPLIKYVTYTRIPFCGRFSNPPRLHHSFAPMKKEKNYRSTDNIANVTSIVWEIRNSTFIRFIYIYTHPFQINSYEFRHEGLRLLTWNRNRIKWLVRSRNKYIFHDD